MPVTRSSPFGTRDSAGASGHRRVEGRPTTARPTLMEANTPTSSQKGVHDASAEPPRVPVGSDCTTIPNMVTSSNTPVGDAPAGVAW